ncbi:MAG: hypothetical protein M1831_005467 [Alyxoria varia]|nr:MAG: hypothetical protein M1831_005467 [Alyxoria varia]
MGYQTLGLTAALIAFYIRSYPFQGSLRLYPDKRSAYTTLCPLCGVLDCTEASPENVRPSSNTNYLGAFLFISYVVAALLVTGKLVWSLRVNYRNMSHAAWENPAIRGFIALFTMMSVLSFGLLSFNMLSFLVESHGKFGSAQSKFKIPFITSTKRAVSDSYGGSIWNWMTSSSLFFDFASQLLNSPSAFEWSEKALTLTMMSMLYMGAAGKRYQVPDLHWFFFCAQILPVSFALNLFFLATLLTSRSAENNTGGSDSAEWIRGPSMYIQAEGGLHRFLHEFLKFVASVTACVAYEEFVASSICVLTRRQFLEKILAARLFLLFPYYWDLYSAGSLPLLVFVGVGLILWPMYDSATDFESTMGWRAKEGAAPKTLAQDAVVAALSSCFYLLVDTIFSA